MQIQQGTATRQGLQYLNLNLELSRRLQDVRMRQRPLLANNLVAKIAGPVGYH